MYSVAWRHIRPLRLPTTSRGEFLADHSWLKTQSSPRLDPKINIKKIVRQNFYFLLLYLFILFQCPALRASVQKKIWTSDKSSWWSPALLNMTQYMTSLYMMFLCTMKCCKMIMCFIMLLSGSRESNRQVNVVEEDLSYSTT